VNIVELLDRAVRSNPAALAFIDGHAGHERQVSYAAFETASRRLATLFAGAGLQPGDGVAVMLPMSADLYLVIVAAWRVGLVPVFIDPEGGEEHFAHCVSRYPIKAFVGTPAVCLLRYTSHALKAIQTLFVSGVFFPGARSLRAAHSLPPYTKTCDCTPGTPAMLTFTSGTTGRPKGIVRTHGLLQAMHSVLAAHIEPTVGEVVLATMPVFTLTYLACGATSLIPDVDLRHPGKIDPRSLARQIAHWNVASSVASPALLERLADDCLMHELRLDTLRKVFVGGAPVFPRLLEKLGRVAHKAEVCVLYGSTEAEPMALISRADVSSDDVGRMLQGRGLLVGKPVPEIKLRVLHDRWGCARLLGNYHALEQETLRPGESGEIVVTGRHVAQGYLDREDDRNIKFRVGSEIWHRTGDAGWLDEQGRLWLLGRCATRIDDAYGTLYPYTVEAALSSHPAIVHSALLHRTGERVLVLEMQRGKQPDVPALLARLSWANIGAIVQVKEMPMDSRHNAKVVYPRLHSLLDEGQWLQRIDTPLVKK